MDTNPDKLFPISRTLDQHSHPYELRRLRLASVTSTAFDLEANVRRLIRDDATDVALSILEHQIKRIRALATPATAANDNGAFKVCGQNSQLDLKYSGNPADYIGLPDAGAPRI